MQQEFPLLAKWVSRKFASVAVFYVFLSQLKGPSFAKIVCATVVTGIYLVVNAVQNIAEKRAVTDDTQEFRSVQ